MPPSKKYHRRPDGLYETTRTDPRTKKRVHFYGKTPREVDLQILDFANRMEQGRFFSEVAEEWKDVHFPTLAHNTLRSYKPAFARAVEEFGECHINQVRPPQIKGYINTFARGGRARKTVSTQLLILSLIFSHAVQSGDIDHSPCDHISIPKGLPKSHREAASLEDEEAIKSKVDGWLLPYLLLYTGLRKGEALALTWGDIDLKENLIYVTKSVYHDGTIPCIKTPKTEAGVRAVPILHPLRYRLMLENKKGNGYIFSPDNGGRPLNQGEYSRFWKEYVLQTGITATAHQLRHSYATMIFECGLEIKDAQDLLGHSTAAMTQDIYTHLRNSRKQQTAQILNEKLNKLPKVVSMS